MSPLTFIWLCGTHSAYPSSSQQFACFLVPCSLAKTQELGLQAAYIKDENTYICARCCLYHILQHNTSLLCSPNYKRMLQLNLNSWLTTLHLHGPTCGLHHHGLCLGISSGQIMVLQDEPKNKKGHLSINLLIHLLHEEGTTVNLQAHLVSKKNFLSVNVKIIVKCSHWSSNIWDNYRNRFKTPSQLLKACSKLVHAPNINKM